MENHAISPPSDAHKHIWIITGPAGCGKTSVAQYLHKTFDFPYLEGDDYHTAEAVAKMGSGHPLTDADRWDWLIRLREEALAVLEGRKPSHQPQQQPQQQPTNGDAPAAPASNVIVTCSALRRRYRDVLRIAALEARGVAVHFVFLAVGEEALLERVRGRQGHYMKEDMVRSQLASLETPDPSLERDAVAVDATMPPDQVSRAAAKVVADVGGVGK